MGYYFHHPWMLLLMLDTYHLIMLEKY